MAEEIAFTAKVQVLGRLAIPKNVREALQIANGDLVAVRMSKIRSRKDLSKAK